MYVVRGRVGDRHYGSGGFRGLGRGFWEHSLPITRGREGRGEAVSEERGMVMSLAGSFALNLSFPAQTLR